MDWMVLQARVFVLAGEFGKAKEVHAGLAARISDLALAIEEARQAIPTAGISRHENGGGANRAEASNHKQPTSQRGSTAPPSSRGSTGSPQAGTIPGGSDGTDRASDQATDKPMPVGGTQRLAQVIVLANKERQANQGEQAETRLRTAFESAGWRETSAVSADEAPWVLDGASRVVRSGLDKAVDKALASLKKGDRAETDQHLKDIEVMVAALQRWERHDRAAPAMLRLMQSRDLAVRVLRTGSVVLEQWAASLERLDLTDPQREQRVQTMLQLAANIDDGAASDVLAVLERTVGFLQSSRATSVAKTAKKRLAEWAVRRLERAKGFEQQGKSMLAAREFEQSFSCDATQVESLFRAASIYEKEQEAALAIPLFKQVAGLTDLKLAAASRKRLAAYQTASRQNLERIPPVQLRPRTESQWQDLLKLIRTELSILCGGELQLLTDKVRNGDLTGAGKELVAMLKKLNSEELIPEVTNAIIAAAPKIGEDFVFAGGDVACSWSPSTGSDSGFWYSTVTVNKAFWTQFSASKIGVADTQGKGPGYLSLSYPRSEALCRELTRKERAAKRLPAGYAYAIPSRAELKRIRNSAGQLPFLPAVAVWTRDASPNTYSLGAGSPKIAKRFVAMVATDHCLEVEGWQAPPDTATRLVFVLARQ